jgi:5-aminolevulinate synthase
LDTPNPVQFDFVYAIKVIDPNHFFLSPTLVSTTRRLHSFLKQQKNVSLLKKHLLEENIPYLDNSSHIIPIMVNNPLRCKEISNILLNNFRHYIQPINYPTVPAGTERLRITPGPLHTEKMIQKLTFALKYAFKITEHINYKKPA